MVHQNICNVENDDGSSIFSTLYIARKERYSIRNHWIVIAPYRSKISVCTNHTGERSHHRNLAKDPQRCRHDRRIWAQWTMKKWNDYNRLFPDCHSSSPLKGPTFEEPKHIPDSTQIIEAPKQGRFIHNIHIRHTTPLGQLDNQLPDADWRTWFMIQDDRLTRFNRRCVQWAREPTCTTELVPLSATYDDKSTETPKSQQFQSEPSNNLNESLNNQRQPQNLDLPLLDDVLNVILPKWRNGVLVNIHAHGKVSHSFCRGQHEQSRLYLLSHHRIWTSWWIWRTDAVEHTKVQSRSV